MAMDTRRIIYLYVKTHNKTGLKYLGKTENDPFKYKGSGKYWKKHLKIHGNDVKTEVIKECATMEEVLEWGVYFSKLWNVVESKEWANLIEENGAGFTSERAKKLAKEKLENGSHIFLTNNPNIERVNNGTHVWLDSEWQKKYSRKRVSEGTHHLLGGKIQRQAVKEGKASCVQKWTCEYCGNTGSNLGLYSQWHKNGKCLERSSKPSGSKAPENHISKINNPFNSQNNFIYECQHCGKSGKGRGNYIRYHSDGKCKSRNQG